MNWIDTHRITAAPPSRPIQPGQVLENETRTQTEEVIFTTGARLVQTSPVFQTAEQFMIDDHGKETMVRGHFQFHEAAGIHNPLPAQVEIHTGPGTPELLISDNALLRITFPHQTNADAFYLQPPGAWNGSSSPSWLKEARVYPNQPEVVQIQTNAQKLELDLVVPWNIYAGAAPGLSYQVRQNQNWQGSRHGT